MDSVPRPVRPFFLDLTPDEVEHLQGCLAKILRDGMLILGPNTERFEEEFARATGVSHAVAVSTGTAAIEILLDYHGARGRRVAVPTNTNFATVAAVLHRGGHPVFLDMDPETFAPKLEMVRAEHGQFPLAGVVWVHIGGVISAEFPAVVAWCRANGVFLIEDAAHAHGSRLGGTAAGAFADGGAFSFFPTKVMTTMEGGMITTNDAEAAAFARSYRNQGKRAATFGNDHRDLGNSWRMNELGAAIGLVQLQKLDAMLERRGVAAAQMSRALDRLGVGYVRIDHMDRAANYKLIVRTAEAAGAYKARFGACGVVLGGGVYDTPCHLQPVFAGVEAPRGGLGQAETWCPRHICPPLTSGMSDSDVERVCASFSECLSTLDAGASTGGRR